MSGLVSDAGAAAAGYAIGSIPFGLLLGRAHAGPRRPRGGQRQHGLDQRAPRRRAGGRRRDLRARRRQGNRGGALRARSRAPARGGQVGAGLAAMVGHSWPVFAGFRGGKSVATAFGALLAISPEASAWAVAGGLSALLGTRIVSVGSLVAAASATVGAGVAAARGGERAPLVFAGLASTLVALRHTDNLRRLARGAEPRVSLSRRVADRGCRHSVTPRRGWPGDQPRMIGGMRRPRPQRLTGSARRWLAAAVLGGLAARGGGDRCLRAGIGRRPQPERQSHRARAQRAAGPPQPARAAHSDTTGFDVARPAQRWLGASALSADDVPEHPEQRHHGQHPRHPADTRQHGIGVARPLQLEVVDRGSACGVGAGGGGASSAASTLGSAPSAGLSVTAPPPVDQLTPLAGISFGQAPYLWPLFLLLDLIAAGSRRGAGAEDLVTHVRRRLTAPSRQAA